MIMFTGLLSWEYHDLHSLASIQRPGARFSTPPVIYGPINLSGPLSRNFIGPKVAFLEAPVNFPGTYQGPKKMAGRYQTLARALYGRPQKKENELERERERVWSGQNSPPPAATLFSFAKMLPPGNFTGARMLP